MFNGLIFSLGIDVVVDLPGVGANLCNRAYSTIPFVRSSEPILKPHPHVLEPITTASYLIKNGTVNGEDSNIIPINVLDADPRTHP